MSKRKCKHRNGTGWVQIAPGARGIKKCPYCEGRDNSKEEGGNK